MKLDSIQTKITLLVGACLLIMSTIIVGYAVVVMRGSAENARDEAVKAAEQYAVASAKQHANHIQVVLEVPLDAARTLAQTFSGIKSEDAWLELGREEVNGILRTLLERNPEFAGVYTCWEPNAFDEMDNGYKHNKGHDATGRLIPYWRRDESGNAILEPLTDYEKEGAGDYYLLPKRSKNEHLMEADFSSVQGKEMLITSLVVPIIANEQFYGVVGIDFRLDAFQALVDDVKELYDGAARIVIYSYHGALVALTGKPELRGKHIRDIHEDWEEDITYIQKGEIKIEKDKSRLEVFTPIKAGNTAASWSVSILIPYEKITETADKQLRQANDDMLKMVGAGIAAILAVIFILYFLTTRGIVRPLRRAVALSGQLAAGNLAARAEIHNARDETGQLLTAMNEMAEKHQNIIQALSTAFGKLAEGDMRARIIAEFAGDFSEIKRAGNTMAEKFQAVIGETSKNLAQLSSGRIDIQVSGEFTGDFVEIKEALKTTAAQLAEATARKVKETWLKSGQTQLNEQISGEQKILQLAQNVINFLTPYLEAQVGAFYLYEEAKEKHPARLRMLATYAYTWRKGMENAFELGEGGVGQAALECKAIVIIRPPEDYMVMKTGLGEAPPHAILLIPFLYEDDLKGVIELASFNLFTETQMDLLKQVMPAIAIAVNTAESRTRMQVLLEQSQTQTEELQAQQEKMQTANAELESQKQEMQTQQENLYQNNEELQSQSEELQTQQEELRQTNEQLEVRTRDLEREREAIRIKNLELEKTRQAIQTKAEELELASKYKSEFLANMSHELRTPLNSLLILAQVLAENKENNLTEKQRECAQTIHSAGTDLLTLINEILDLSKVEAGKTEIQPEDLAFAPLVKSLDGKFRAIAEDKKLSFEFRLAKDLPARLHADPQRLVQVINNLLSNAFKFTSEGGVVLEIRRPARDENLSRSGLDSAAAVAISVVDTGIGVPKEKQKVIFEAFQQADGTTSRRYGGTGLGLSITRRLVQLMGGEIQLHSEEGKGSRFTAYLPERVTVLSSVSPRKQDVLAMESRKISSLSQRESGEDILDESRAATDFDDDREALHPEDKSILIIEDDEKFSAVLKELAREKGFKCLTADDGKYGLQLAEKYSPRAIILDIGLPQMDGWLVMERLKDNPNTRHIPVHFISGSDDLPEARKMGAIGYSMKPVGMGELGEIFNKIERVINKTVKNLLAVVDAASQRQAILEIVGNDNVEVAQANTRAEALQHLGAMQCDCIILDVSVEQNAGIGFLELLRKEEAFTQIPVIIYAERDLTEQEETVLQESANTLTVKEVRSRERLLDETTLFLHQVNAQLPQEQQQMLRMVHDKETILAGRKILLADDDIRNIFALGTILEEKEMEVVIGNDGEEALELLEEHQDIDLVLMDIMMPKMDGYEAIQKIRKQSRFRKLPIIALTAKAMKDDRQKCIEAGANDYLPKPIDANKLISLMRVWLYR